MTRRRRIWCELLPANELAAPATLALLERYRLEPIIALPPARETDELARALSALSARGLRIGLWPLLDDDDGYWPSDHNADRFADRVSATLAFAARANARVQTIAVDLEPPLEISRRLLNGALLSRTAALLGGALDLRNPAEREARRRSGERFRALGRELAAQKIETIAAVLPMVVLDLASRAPLWQALLRTPVEAPSWDVISPMLYTSLIAPSLPSKSMESARAILHQCCELLVARVGADRASISVGLVGPGKLGDEPHYSDPRELAADVAAALAAGVDDLALFSLETAIARGPEAWLDAFTETRADRPRGLRTEAVSGLVRAAAWATRPLSLFNPHLY